MHYQRHIDPDGDDSLAQLLRRIPPGATVLELGPATGYCTRHLKEVLGCTVDAIELSAEMAELARPWCRDIVVGDVEHLDLQAVLAGRRYDVILCADVLEHLRDPWSLARRLQDRIGNAGRLLVSVPNVAYLGLLVDLLRGNFRYRDEGLLDRTHLRFFTFASLSDLLEDSGWHVWAADQVPLSLTDSEFRVRLESLAPALRDELLARPDALCYQWVVEARPQPPAQRVTLPVQPAEDRFQIRVFWHSDAEPFVETQNRLVWGRLGRTNQPIAVTIPTDQSAIALRLSDRVCFIRLHRIQLYDSSDATLWSWRPSAGPLPTASCEGLRVADPEGLWFVGTTDSRLQLDMPAALVARVQRLELQLDAPMSADYLAARAYWDHVASDPGTPATEFPQQQALLELAYGALGPDPASWADSARLLRFCRMLPGLTTLVNLLAAVRRRLRN